MIPTHPLQAITHLDGRNRSKLTNLENYFSELAWMQYRLEVMVKYLQFLLKEKIIKGGFDQLNSMLNIKLTTYDGEKIADIEKTTNHDLRALEIYLKEKLKNSGLSELSASVNFGIGSEDINNVALRIQVKKCFNEVILPDLIKLIASLIDFIKPITNMHMLARTHGQPASVTTLGKELGLYLDRIVRELDVLNSCKFHPKFSGEVGNFNALHIVKLLNWREIEGNFLKSLGFESASFATQIPPYDDLIRFFDSWKRLNNILIGFAKEIWLYASFDYLILKQPQGEVGSSGMPHKINPQYFEGSEGGLEIANALLEFFSRKFSYNRLQRDFSDSTVRRNIVLVFAYSLLSYQSLITGISRIQVNEKILTRDLAEHYEVLSETWQTLLKQSGDEEAFTLVQQTLRGKRLNKREYNNIIQKLSFSNVLKNRLTKLSPHMLAGDSEKISQEIAHRAGEFIKKI